MGCAGTQHVLGFATKGLILQGSECPKKLAAEGLYLAGNGPISTVILITCSNGYHEVMRTCLRQETSKRGHDKVIQNNEWHGEGRLDMSIYLS